MANCFLSTSLITIIVVRFSGIPPAHCGQTGKKIRQKTGVFSGDFCFSRTIAQNHENSGVSGKIRKTWQVCTLICRPQDRKKRDPPRPTEACSFEVMEKVEEKAAEASGGRSGWTPPQETSALLAGEEHPAWDESGSPSPAASPLPRHHGSSSGKIHNQQDSCAGQAPCPPGFERAQYPAGGAGAQGATDK